MADQRSARGKSFLSMTTGSRIPLSKAKIHNRSASKSLRTAPASIYKAIVLEPSTTEDVLSTNTIVKPHSTISKATIDTTKMAPRTVRFPEKPSIPHNFDPEDCPSLIKVKYTGQWERLKPESASSWRPYPGRSQREAARLCGSLYQVS